MEQRSLPRIEPVLRTIRTRRFLVPALMLLACSLFIWQSYRTTLPAHRPPDFMLQDQVIHWLGGGENTFTVSAAVCEYRTNSRTGTIEDFTTCALTDRELDDLYTLVRTNRFDRIGRVAISIRCFVNRPAQSSHELRLTANGTTYRKSPPECAPLYSGRERYDTISGELGKLRNQIRRVPRADFLMDVRPGAGDAAYAAFPGELYNRHRGSICSVRSSFGITTRGAWAITLCPDTPAGERRKIATELRDSQMAARVFEDVPCDNQWTTPLICGENMRDQ